MTPAEELDAARMNWEHLNAQKEEAEKRFISLLRMQTDFKVGDIVEARKYRNLSWRDAVVRGVRIWGYGGPLAQPDYTVSFRLKGGEFSKVETSYCEVRQIGSDVERATFTGKITEDML